jgi:hypothetical protein
VLEAGEDEVLSADVIGIRAARNAGNTPPATPIRTASTIPTTSDVPLIRKANPISAKFVPMAAEVMPSAGRASRQPSAPPTMARTVDSTTNAVRMLTLENPSARSVPISRVRAATSAYIVFMAPSTAPMPITMATNTASPRSCFETTLD